MSIKGEEDKVRRLVRKHGLVLRKSRVRNINPDNLGGYMIWDEETNSCIFGDRFDLELQNIEKEFRNWRVINMR